MATVTSEATLGPSCAAVGSSGAAVGSAGADVGSAGADVGSSVAPQAARATTNMDSTKRNAIAKIKEMVIEGKSNKDEIAIFIEDTYAISPRFTHRYIEERLKNYNFEQVDGKLKRIK